MNDVLCECGHDKCDHPENTDDEPQGICWVEDCNCQQFTPLATFTQLKEAMVFTDKALNFLKAIELWEAGFICDDKVWERGGCQWTAEQQERWIELQKHRNALLAEARRIRGGEKGE